MLQVVEPEICEPTNIVSEIATAKTHECRVQSP